jgi:beta-N-acetylhexosaminidase
MDTSQILGVLNQKLMLSFDGFEPTPELFKILEGQAIGGLTLYRSLNVQNPAQVSALTTALQQAASKAGGGQLLIGADQEGGQLVAVGGGTTPFPGNLALGAAGSEDLARKVGAATGRELAAMGININYAPVCDVLVNPGNPSVGLRSFGSDPDLVSRLGAALIEGLQSAGVAACAKHFPGLGDTATDSHYGTPVVLHNKERLRRVELPPFKTAIEAGVKMVMAAHIALPAFNDGRDLPSTLSPGVLRGLLRQDLGFSGVIASDALDMKAIEQGPGLVIDVLAACAAGVDLLLFGPQTSGRETLLVGLLQAVRRGLLSAEDMQASAGRILALKEWLSGFERPALDVVGCVEHQALALEVARRSVTLVQDVEGQVPLQLDPDSRLLVILPQPANLTPADTSSYETPSLARFIWDFHPAVEEISIPLDPSGEQVANLLQQARDYDHVLVGTINAFAHPGQAALVNALLEVGVHTLGVGLRMPHDLLSFPRLPLFAAAYSLQPPSLQAVVDALWGEIPFEGKLPVPIKLRL